MSKCNNKIIHILALLMTLLIILLTLSGCGIASTSIKKYSKPNDLETLSSDVIAKNSNYALSFDESKCSISVLDSSGTKVFSTSPDTDGSAVDEFGLPIKNHQWIDSPILVDYVSSETLEVRTITAAEAIEDGTVESKKIDSGIEVTYYFEDIQVSVPVKFKLEESSINISVDANNITENKERVASVTVAPMACAIANTASSNEYLFYPSGSGALIFPHEYDIVGKRYTEQVFGTDSTMKKYGNMDMFSENPIRLPVFGAKNGDKAILAVIDEGKDSALVECWVGSSALRFSNVYATFSVRGYDWSTRMTVDASKIYSKYKSDQKFSVSYYFLENDKANYSGMAELYREMFIGKTSIVKDDIAPLSVKLYGGEEITASFLGIPYTRFCKLTDLDDTKNILLDIVQNTKVKPAVQLIGYGKNGISTNSNKNEYRINSKLGTKKELSDLFKWAENENISMYYNFDLIKTTNKSDSSLSANGSSNYQYLYNISSKSRENSMSKYFLLSRNKIESSVNKMITKAKKMGIDNVSLSLLGSISYSDYSLEENYCKGNMSNAVTEFFENIKKGDFNIATNSANSYVAALSNIVMDIPTSSAQSFAFDADIPFYSMVFKGYVPMTTESINLSDTPDMLYLKAAESGVGLGYSAISDYDVDLKDIRKSGLSQMQYDNVSKIISKYSEDYNEYFEKIKFAKISRHTYLSNGASITEFDNGITTYVNFSDEAKTINGVSVDALDYYWTEAK